MVAQLTKDWLDGVLGKYENAPVDSHAYGVVTSINADGSYQVQLNSSSERARCAAFCSASLGDKVVVLIFSDGRAAAIATLGGEGGGGGGTSSDMAYTVLFASAEGTTSDFSLSESAGNFEMLEFQYTDGLRHMTKRVFQPNGKAVALDRSVSNPEQGTFTHSAIATISGSSVAMSNQGGLRINVENTPTYQPISAIKVTAVLGWSNATEFPNPSNYYLKAEVDTAIEEAVEGIDVPEVDLTDYYTKAETNEAIAAIDIPTVPTVVSAFENDAGYLTADTVGAFYKGGWIATETTGIGQRYTETITLPAGTYVVSVVLPYASSGADNLICIGFSAAMAIGTGNTFLKAAYGATTMLAKFTTTTNLYVLSSASMNSATWGYLDRGGIAAVRIA